MPIRGACFVQRRLDLPTEMFPLALFKLADATLGAEELVGLSERLSADLHLACAQHLDPFTRK
eukprot:182120-Alexandrium_andersonii.AAC.1